MVVASTTPASVVRPAVLFTGILAVFVAVYAYRVFLPAPLLDLIPLSAASLTPQWVNYQNRVAEVPKEEPFVCRPSNYTMEIISVDPLLIYINEFITPKEGKMLMDLASDKFNPSKIYVDGENKNTDGRTSHSAVLERTHDITACILDRAQKFMGSMYVNDDGWNRPQLVRYEVGQKFDVHSDWFVDIQTEQYTKPDGTVESRRWNRMASFFVILESNCTAGETWFPNINRNHILGQDPSLIDHPNSPVQRMRKHEKGGYSFKPIPGNGLFWVNLKPDGSGDSRTLHAGLPLDSGYKVGLNLWSKKWFP